jgi:hypothetical protein
MENNQLDLVNQLKDLEYKMKAWKTRLRSASELTSSLRKTRLSALPKRTTELTRHLLTI